MNDEHLEEQLSAYLDGDLDTEAARDVAARLADSVEARAIYEDLQRLRVESLALSREVMPERDLWVDIAPRLEPHAPARVVAWPRVPPWTFGALAAAALVLVGLSFFLQAPVDDGPAPSAPGNDVALAWQRDVRTAEQQYRESKEALTAALAERERDLAPETLTVLESNLEAIDTAVNEIRQAMATDPQEPRLLRLLVATQEKELSLLQRILEAPEGS